MEHLLKKETLEVMALTSEQVNNIFKAELDSKYYDEFVKDRVIGKYLIDKNLFNLLYQYIEDTRKLSKDEKENFDKELKDLIKITFKY